LLTLQAGVPAFTKNAVDRQCGHVLGHPARQKIDAPMPFQEISGCAA
jgi:hypothetical protein